MWQGCRAALDRCHMGRLMWQVYWRVVAFVRSRPYPFVLPGYTLFYCWRCRGWGQDIGGYECSTCEGRGYDR